MRYIVAYATLVAGQDVAYHRDFGRKLASFTKEVGGKLAPESIAITNKEIV